jgi:hypothetical protein
MTDFGHLNHKIWIKLDHDFLFRGDANKRAKTQINASKSHLTA